MNRHIGPHGQPCEAFRGIYVMSWSQVSVDGMQDLAPEDLTKGSKIQLSGTPVRLDGPQDFLSLGQAKGKADLQKRAGRVARKLVTAALGADAVAQSVASDGGDVQDPDLANDTIILTDGYGKYEANLIRLSGHQPLVMFVDMLPPQEQNARGQNPQGRDLWVVDLHLEPQHPIQTKSPSAIISSGIDPLITTPMGERPIGDLRQGDLVMTRDNGPQPIVWIGRQEFSGARLHSTPTMRPIQINAHAFGPNTPAYDVILSPNQKVLARGQVALDLYNSDEVLLAAKDLINGRNIYYAPRLQQAVWYHLITPQHNIVMVNGAPCETFHPGQEDLKTLPEGLQSSLYKAMPNAEWAPEAYGTPARRVLNRAEAALFMHKWA